MTRVVFVDEDLVILLESDLPPADLVEVVLNGTWLPPASLAEGMLLRAVRLGRLVIVSPVEPITPGMHPVPEGISPLVLSRRQRQVLQGLADGLSNKEIGARLGLHKRTVDLHIAAIKGRFGTNSRMQSVMRGVALGLCKIKPDSKETPDIGYTWPNERGPTRSHPPRKDDEERTNPDSPDQ